jgi:hypothetical protein
MNPTESFSQVAAAAPQPSNIDVGVEPPTLDTSFDPNAGRHPLRPLVDAWLNKIKAGNDYKRRVFSEFAEEILYFFKGGSALNSWMWGPGGRGRGGYMEPGGQEGEDEMAPPQFRYTMNKVAELLQLFAPTLYYSNPVRTVTPRRLEPVPPEIYQVLAGPPPQVPPAVMQAAQTNPQLQAVLAQMQQVYQQQIVQQAQQQQTNDAATEIIDKVRAELMSDYLNWTPNELDLKTHSRRVIDECLLKGMGVWWTELYVQRGFGTKLVGSFFDTVDNLVLDPDVQQIDDCMWCCRIRTTPQWDLEDAWGLPRGALNGSSDTIETVAISSETMTDPDGLNKRRLAVTNKMVTSYEVWSKMGLGGRMTGIEPQLKQVFDGLGDYCHLVLVNGVPYPLNLPSKMVANVPDQYDPAAASAWAEGMRKAVEWPIPFWAFSDGWPFTSLIFHEVPNQIWPMSHFTPGLGELKWINWAMSWLASKVKNACGTIIAVMKGMDEQEKRKLIQVGDQKVVEVEIETGNAQDVNKLISYVQQPDFHPAIYEMVDRTSEVFDKRVGASALLYGMTGGAADRSATETQLKQQNSSIRLKDMADRVQDRQTVIARKEAFVAKWFLTAQDVAPCLGPDRAKLWEQLVANGSVEQVIRELDYRIEAGSMQIMDRQAKIQNHAAIMQSVMPFLQQVAMQWGEVGPWNALMEDWGKLNQMEVSRYMIQPPQQFQSQPPAGAPAPQGGPAQGGAPQPGQEQQQAPQPRPNQHGVNSPPRQNQ